jgi:hypothetical protein
MTGTTSPHAASSPPNTAALKAIITTRKTFGAPRSGGNVSAVRRAGGNVSAVRRVGGNVSAVRRVGVSARGLRPEIVLVLVLVVVPCVRRSSIVLVLVIVLDPLV